MAYVQETTRDACLAGGCGSLCCTYRRLEWVLLLVVSRLSDARPVVATRAKIKIWRHLLVMIALCWVGLLLSTLCMCVIKVL